MKLTAIILARAIAFVEVQELNPEGKAYYPNIAAALVKRFNFQVYPTKPEDFDETKGITFADGKFTGGTVDRVQIFNHGIVVDTRISTNESVVLLHDTLVWAVSELGLIYEESMIKRRAFVSQVTIESNLKLEKLNPVLGRVSGLLSDKLTTAMGQTVLYEATGITLNLDTSVTSLTPGHFSLERRLGVPFRDNKYFSTAPLSTSDHISLLQELENALL